MYQGIQGDQIELKLINALIQDWEDVPTGQHVQTLSNPTSCDKNTSKKQNWKIISQEG